MQVRLPCRIRDDRTGMQPDNGVEGIKAKRSDCDGVKSHGLITEGTSVIDGE